MSAKRPAEDDTSEPKRQETTSPLLQWGEDWSHTRDTLVKTAEWLCFINCYNFAFDMMTGLARRFPQEVWPSNDDLEGALMESAEPPMNVTLISHVVQTIEATLNSQRIADGQSVDDNLADADYILAQIGSGKDLIDKSLAQARDGADKQVGGVKPVVNLKKTSLDASYVTWLESFPLVRSIVTHEYPLRMIKKAFLAKQMQIWRLISETEPGLFCWAADGRSRLQRRDTQPDRWVCTNTTHLANKQSKVCNGCSSVSTLIVPELMTDLIKAAPAGKMFSAFVLPFCSESSKFASGTCPGVVNCAITNSNFGDGDQMQFQIRCADTKCKREAKGRYSWAAFTRFCTPCMPIDIPRWLNWDEREKRIIYKTW